MDCIVDIESQPVRAEVDPKVEIKNEAIQSIAPRHIIGLIGK